MREYRYRMKNRSSLEVAAAVLHVALQPTNKTKIMFLSETSARQLKPVLEKMLDKELISYDPNSKTFSTTDRGREFLQLYQSMIHGLDFQRASPKSIKKLVS